MLKTTCDSLTVGLESTGTYGEAVRRALTIGGFKTRIAK
jgi:transposase